MNKYFYDLHVHSCLSPCADNDMTPANIAGMASINGLNIVALTDHNSVKNCAAFFAAAKKFGIVPVPGIEMTTAEDVHVVALFPSLENAEAFGAEYETHRILYKNKPEIFGDQLIVDEEDNVIGSEENLLINATSLSISEATALAEKYGAAVFPAHIDREENGIIQMLGALPESPYFPTVELNDGAKKDEYEKKYALGGRLILTDSDAHHLWQISEAENFIEIDDEPYSSALVRENLIKKLKGQ